MRDSGKEFARLQESIDSGLQDMRFQFFTELTKLENGFSSLVKVHQSEITNLMSSSHGHLQEELRKVWVALGNEGRHSEPGPPQWQKMLPTPGGTPQATAQDLGPNPTRHVSSGALVSPAPGALRPANSDAH